ncbi:MAG TPA: cytochrome c biogenesis protein CcdA [Candidatus Nanoarchaeia archaeon]|nr:cytochrome c biogenesis protein CcdA [Candidatus Nanoarchaeia archaeon]
MGKKAALNKVPRDWRIFFCSAFFVLGFSLVFSIVGVLLQSALANISYELQKWLGRLGGIIIILFGLFLLGLLRIPFLEQEHKFHVKRKFGSAYLTSFVFGAAFAVGWTPCVGAVLGAVLTLAVTHPGTAFWLLIAYTLGLGIPFLLVGFFVNEAQSFLNRAGKWIQWMSYLFGAILIILGILVFTNQLSRVAGLAFASEFLIDLNAGSPASETGINIGIAFFAGLVSFLSPCVLPLIPGFLSYLASLSVKRE